MFCYSSFWIGLYTDGSGKYYWQDKPSEVAYQRNAFWRTKQPDAGANSQQCIGMWLEYQGKWYDHHCHTKMPYICQYKITEIQRGNYKDVCTRIQ